jgi:hypothetical protein
LAALRAPEGVRRAPCDTRSKVSDARIELTESNFTQWCPEGADAPPGPRASARDHPFPVALGQHVTALILVEVPEPDLIQALGPSAEIGPLELAEARIPPRLACREQQIVDAIAVEVTDPVASVRIKIDDVVGPEMDDVEIVSIVDMNRIVAPIILEAFVGKNVVMDIDAGLRPSANLDRGTRQILKGVLGEPELRARPAAETVVGLCYKSVVFLYDRLT